MSSNKIDIKPLKKWEDFFTHVRYDENESIVGRKIFRGHAIESWKLSSKFERLLQSQRDSSEELGHLLGLETDKNRSVLVNFGPNRWEGYRAYRDNYLNRFKESATGIPGLQTGEFNEDDHWWTLGRHFGLITPLLDWTFSPYIAAFFAFSEYAEIHYKGFKSGVPYDLPTFDDSRVVIWVLSPIGDLEKKEEFEIIREHQDYFYRQRAQRGVFTKLTHEVHLDLESYLLNIGKANYLERIEIPGVEWVDALNDLELMNIKYDTLFPDLEGASLQANITPLIR